MYFNLVCSNSYWKSSILALHGIAEVIGNLFFGLLSDKFGNHLIFFVALSLSLSSAVSPIFVKNIWVFSVCRFLTNFTCNALYNIPYITITEIIGPQHRTFVSVVGLSSWTLGMCLVSVVAYFSRDWVILTAIPGGLVLPMFLYWKLLPESPRYLISKGEYDEAKQVLDKIANVNGKEVPKNLMEQLRNLSLKQESQSKGSIVDLLKYSWIRKKFLILIFCWTSNVCAYRVLLLNFENLSGNEFINWFLLSVIEFPSNIVSGFLMESRLGRRWTNAFSMFLGGVALSLTLVFPEYVLAFSLTGKFLSNISYNVSFQQTPELFPTQLRNQAMAYTTAISAATNFALPYLSSTGKEYVWLPLVSIGCMCLMSGVANSFLPETLRENLPHTLEDGNSFGRDAKYFSFAKNSKGSG